MAFFIGVLIAALAVGCTVVCLGLCRAAGEYDEMQERAWRDMLREEEEKGGR